MDVNLLIKKNFISNFRKIIPNRWQQLAIELAYPKMPKHILKWYHAVPEKFGNGHSIPLEMIREFIEEDLKIPFKLGPNHTFKHKDYLNGFYDQYSHEWFYWMMVPMKSCVDTMYKFEICGEKTDIKIHWIFDYKEVEKFRNFLENYLVWLREQ